MSTNLKPDQKIYLGDAVYANYDGYHVVLTTENGISTTNKIFLEPPVYQALIKYVEHLKMNHQINM